MHQRSVRVLAGFLAIIAVLLPGPLVSTSPAADIMDECPRSANSSCPMQDNVGVNAEVGAIGEEKTVDRTVWARERWNALGIRVGPGESYQIIWNNGQTWCDCTIPSSPSGYTSGDARGREGASILTSLAFNALSERLRRVRTANWFALVCGVNDRPESYRAIDPGKVWSTPKAEDWDRWIGDKTGRLGCFANDIGRRLFSRDFYGNNSGSIKITVKRVKPESPAQ